MRARSGTILVVIAIILSVVLGIVIPMASGLARTDAVYLKATVMTTAAALGEEPPTPDTLWSAPFMWTATPTPGSGGLGLIATPTSTRAASITTVVSYLATVSQTPSNVSRTATPSSTPTSTTTGVPTGTATGTSTVVGRSN